MKRNKIIWLVVLAVILAVGACPPFSKRSQPRAVRINTAVNIVSMNLVFTAPNPKPADR